MLLNYKGSETKREKKIEEQSFYRVQGKGVRANKNTKKPSKGQTMCLL